MAEAVAGGPETKLLASFIDAPSISSNLIYWMKKVRGVHVCAGEEGRVVRVCVQLKFRMNVCMRERERKREREEKPISVESVIFHEKMENIFDSEADSDVRYNDE